jgi:hypothetical protein
VRQEVSWCSVRKAGALRAEVEVDGCIRVPCEVSLVGVTALSWREEDREDCLWESINSKGQGHNQGDDEREPRFWVLGGIDDRDGGGHLHIRGGFPYGLKFWVLGDGGGRLSKEEKGRRKMKRMRGLCGSAEVMYSC